MAEFVNVMKQKARMCRAIDDCTGCNLSHNNNGKNFGCQLFVMEYPEESEKIIMEWAAAQPELKYPSWSEAWYQLFPNAYHSTFACDACSPCVKHFLPPEKVKCAGVRCVDCLAEPIPADIAEKLGIKPLEV